jgi:hypothetical protein
MSSNARRERTALDSFVEAAMVDFTEFVHRKRNLTGLQWKTLGKVDLKNPYSLAAVMRELMNLKYQSYMYGPKV